MNWFELSHALQDQCKREGQPLSACFELTPLCNLSCNMCYVRLEPDAINAHGNLLSTEDWLELAHETHNMGTMLLEITGGEPTTRPDFNTLYANFIKMGFLVTLRTNAYSITDDHLKLFAELPPQRISITLYGASDKTYAAVCGAPDGFSRVSKNILAMRDKGLNLRLTMTVTKDNENDALALSNWASTNGFNLTTYGGLFAPRKGIKRSISHLKVRPADVDCEVANDLRLAPPDSVKRKYYSSPFWMCKSFGSMFCITWNGKMTLCNALTDVQKNISKGSLATTYRELYRDLSEIKRPEQCGTCKFIEYCISCPVQLRTYTNCLDQTCDEVCRRARRRFKRMHQGANE